MIREAESKDAQVLEDLYRLLVPTSQNIKVLPERVEEIKKDPNNYLFVLEEENKLQGSVFITLCLDPMYQYRPYAVIENLIIAEEFRGQGLGRELLHHVEQFCMNRNCTKMMLVSSTKRIEAHNFFEKLGYNGTISKGFKKYIRIQ